MMDKVKYDLAYNIISPIIENCIKANKGEDGLILVDYAELRDALAEELNTVILRARKAEHDGTGNIFGIGWDNIPGIETLRKQWAERNAVLMKGNEPAIFSKSEQAYIQRMMSNSVENQ